MSPRSRPPGFGGPSPRSRWTVPCWVPAGIRIRFVAVQRRHLDGRARIASATVIGTVDLEVAVVALAEDRRGGDPGDHVEVAGRRAAGAVLALAGDPDPAAVVDAGRDPHPVALALHRQPGAAAGRARVLDHLAGAAALRARLADREEALALGVDPAPVAARAGDRHRPRLRAGAAAGLAGRLLRHRDRDLGPVHRLLEAERAPRSRGRGRGPAAAGPGRRGGTGSRRCRRCRGRSPARPGPPRPAEAAERARRRRTPCASRGPRACRRRPGPP